MRELEDMERGVLGRFQRLQMHLSKILQKTQPSFSCVCILLDLKQFLFNVWNDLQNVLLYFISLKRCSFFSSLFLFFFIFLLAYQNKLAYVLRLTSRGNLPITLKMLFLVLVNGLRLFLSKTRLPSSCCIIFQFSHVILTITAVIMAELCQQQSQSMF